MDIYIKKITTSFLFLFLFVLSFSFSEANCEVFSQDSFRSKDTEEETLSYHSAAISFFVVDMKYSHEQGVQVCEIQPSVISKFSGFDFVNSTRAIIFLHFLIIFGMYQGG